MILFFPDLDTLRLALTSSIVPPDVTLAPATVSFGEHGRLYVEPADSLSRATTKSLDRIGVKGSKRHGSGATVGVTNWLQILPVVKADAPKVSAQAAVLFEIEAAEDLPALVTEMLRLGNDRQGLRWFAPPGEAGARCVLLRVVGPPYYTLLRATDRGAAGTRGAVRAYLEAAPRVWVEIGYAHPLAAQLRVDDGQLLLIRAPREWVFLDDIPFQDVYDVLDFQLPAGPVGLSGTATDRKLTVPLRLAPGNAADVPELWVLRDDATAQLDAFVRDADDRLVQRLMFAVATDPAGTRAVVLRTRPSKLPPPALPLANARAFKPFWKLPNLFVPVGRRLHPTLRRDTVRRLLADDPDLVVWLDPDGGDGFTPEAVPDAAFRPLDDWVDYVIETEREPLTAWIAATRFDFAHFVCQDGGGPGPKPEREERTPKGSTGGVEVKGSRTAGSPKPAGKAKAAPKPPTAETLASPRDVHPPSEWKARREELQKRFLAVDGPPDAPERLALWPELAAANAGEGNEIEASICWLNALWQVDPPPPEWLAGWVRSAYPVAGVAVRAEDLDPLLRAPTPSVGDCRAVLVGFLWLASQAAVSPALRDRIPAIRTYLEAHERALPVRAAWLAGYAMARLGGDDALGLARVRDRLLRHLLGEGLSPERDLPFFLRTAGLRNADRIQAVRDKTFELHRSVRAWIGAAAGRMPGRPGGPDLLPRNLPYVDLLFAFAFAKLGDTTPARQLVEGAGYELVVPVPTAWKDDGQFEDLVAAETANFLFRGFRYRVEHAIAGKAHQGPLSPDLLDAADAISERTKAAAALVERRKVENPRATGIVLNNPYWRTETIINRMRKESWVFDPEESQEPYAFFTVANDPLRKELLALNTVRDPDRFADRVRRLYQVGVPTKPLAEVRFYLLHASVPFAPRVGEAFSHELLARVPDVMATGPVSRETRYDSETVRKQGELLERAIFVAAHYGRADVVRELVNHFADLVHGKTEEDRFRLVNVAVGQCVRSLKKLGMLDEIERFLTRLQAEVLRGGSVSDLRRSAVAKPGGWTTALQTLLNLAGGWLALGAADLATPILDAAREEILAPPGPPLAAGPATELIQAYIAALGHGPSDLGLPRINELFLKSNAAAIPNTWTGNRTYSRLHLNIVEQVVAALVGDDFALGPDGRRWLQSDEQLVRTRIHADMRKVRDRAGV